MIVIHQYKEDVSWVKNLVGVSPVTIVSRFPSQTYSDDNTVTLYEPDGPGAEVCGYLRYIIDNYNALPDQIAFLHGHRNSWHTSNQDELLKVANWNASVYRPPMKRDKWVVTKYPPYNSHGLTELAQHWDEVFRFELGDPLLNESVYYPCGSFIVPKEMIQLRPLSSYQFWYNWTANWGSMDRRSVATEPTLQQNQTTSPHSGGIAGHLQRRSGYITPRSDIPKPAPPASKHHLIPGYMFEYVWHRIFGRSYNYNEDPTPVRSNFAVDERPFNLSARLDRVVVVHHAREDVQWVHYLKGTAPVVIVSRTQPSAVIDYNTIRIYEPDSPGHEANGYLRFIIDNYHHLPKQMAFVHGHRNSWHTAGHQDETLRMAVWEPPAHCTAGTRCIEDGYRPIIRNKFRWNLYTPPNGPKGMPDMTATWDELFLPILGPEHQRELHYYCCGSFFVTPAAVHKRTLDEYKYWQTWLRTSNHTYANKTGWHFEYNWHRIFGMNYSNPDVPV